MECDVGTIPEPSDAPLEQGGPCGARMFPSSSWGLRGATTGAWVDGPRLTESHQGPQGGPANAQPANKTEANEGATVCNTVAPPLGTPSPVLLTLQDVAERFQVSLHTTELLVDSGELRAVLVGPERPRDARGACKFSRAPPARRRWPGRRRVWPQRQRPSAAVLWRPPGGLVPFWSLWSTHPQPNRSNRSIGSRVTPCRNKRLRARVSRK